MASYDSPASEGQKEVESKKISFRFCREWYEYHLSRHHYLLTPV